MTEVVSSHRENPSKGTDVHSKELVDKIVKRFHGIVSRRKYHSGVRNLDEELATSSPDKTQNIESRILDHLMQLNTHGLNISPRIIASIVQLCIIRLSHSGGISFIHSKLLIKLIQRGIVQEKNKNTYSSIHLEQYAEMAEMDLQRMDELNTDLAGVFWFMYTCIADFPYFRVGDKSPTIETLCVDFSRYLNMHFPKKYYTGPTPNEFITRLFRIGDTRGGVSQQSGNCFLVSGLYVLVRNPYFLAELNKNLQHSQGGGLQSACEYRFHTGSSYAIKIDDVRSAYSPPSLGDIEDIYSFALWIRHSHDLRDTLIHTETFSRLGDMLTKGFDEDGTPKRTFIVTIQKQIATRRGLFYTLWQKFVMGGSSLKSIKGPIGYKILEAAYNLHKQDKGENEGKKLPYKGRKVKLASHGGGFLGDVFSDFLPSDSWQINKRMSGKAGEIQVLHALGIINTGRAILGATKSEHAGCTETNTSQIVRNHSYIVGSYNEDSQEVIIANPWNTSKTESLSVHKFLDIFDDIVIALKK